MTFYWWSHWFWITVLAVVLLPPYASVHTYPSQEQNTSLEYNQNSRNVKMGVTKLYQTATATANVAATAAMDVAASSSTISIPSSSEHDDDLGASSPVSASTTTTTTTSILSGELSNDDASVEGRRAQLHSVEQQLHEGTIDGDGESDGDGVSDGDGDGNAAELLRPALAMQQRAQLLGVEAFDEVEDAAADVSAGEGDDDADNGVDLEYKRSAEIYSSSSSNNNNNTNSNKTTSADREEMEELAHVSPLSVDATNAQQTTAAATASASMPAHDHGALSNYTNFSSSAAPRLNATQGSISNNNNNNNNSNSEGDNRNSDNNQYNHTDKATSIKASANATASLSPSSASSSSSASSVSPVSSGVEASTATAGSVPAVPKIETAAGSAEWLNAELAAAASAAADGAGVARSTIIIDHSAINITTNTTTTTTIKTLQNGNRTNASSSTAADDRVPFTLENANKEEELRRAENEHRTRKSKTLSADYKHINRFINYSTDSKNLLARSASTASNTAAEYEAEESNISSEALSVQRAYFLDAGAISAICFTIFGVCCAVGTVGIVLYRRRYMNKPQALSEPDSSVYIDDSTMRVSDNSDEMYSLDNDSFLNSLEAMTIQNYWTDTVKHTKL